MIKMEVSPNITKRDLEKVINNYTHQIVDLLDQIDIYRERRKLLIQRQLEMMKFEQLELQKKLEKVKLV